MISECATIPITLFITRISQLNYFIFGQKCTTTAPSTTSCPQFNFPKHTLYGVFAIMLFVHVDLFIFLHEHLWDHVQIILVLLLFTGWLGILRNGPGSTSGGRRTRGELHSRNVFTQMTATRGGSLQVSWR